MNSKRIILYCLLICLLIPMLTDARIVFKSYRDGSRSLYVMDDDGSNVQKLTDRSGWWPEWSPDGKQIAFTRDTTKPGQDQTAAIYIINSDGTEEYRLTNEETLEYHPTWSPDGQHIAFESNRVDRSDIWRINIATKEMRRLTRTAELTTFPSWSPDGKYIAYREGFEIYLMHADGSGHRELWPGKGIYGRYFPHWSVDSQSVLYMEDRYDAGGNIVSRKVVIHDIKIDKRQVVGTPNNWSIHSASFMGEKHLLISAKLIDVKQSDHDIYRYHLVTGEIVNLTRTPKDDFATDWIDDDVLPVSPQGKKKVTGGTVKQQGSE